MPKTNINHIVISKRWQSSLQDVRVKRGADLASDHHLLQGKIQLKLSAVKKVVCHRRKFNVSKLKNQAVRDEFQLSLQNRFATLDKIETDNDIINWHGKDQSKHY